MENIMPIITLLADNRKYLQYDSASSLIRADGADPNDENCQFMLTSKLGTAPQNDRILLRSVGYKNYYITYTNDSNCYLTPSDPDGVGPKFVFTLINQRVPAGDSLTVNLIAPNNNFVSRINTGGTDPGRIDDIQAIKPSNDGPWCTFTLSYV